jgi:predicted acetyltransferase
MIFHPLFQRSILEISKIVEESTEKGFIVNLRPFGEFRAFGLVETMLLVFTEFQRQGIGRAAVSLLNADEKPRFFVSAISNSVSTAFFGMQPVLIHAYSNHRYRVYKTS